MKRRLLGRHGAAGCLMVDCNDVEVRSLARSRLGEISPRTVPPECAGPKSPSPPPSPSESCKTSDAPAPSRAQTALDILAKRPENELPEPVYERRVVASTSRDNKENSGDDKSCKSEPPTEQQWYIPYVTSTYAYTFTHFSFHTGLRCRYSLFRHVRRIRTEIGVGGTIAARLDDD